MFSATRRILTVAAAAIVGLGVAAATVPASAMGMHMGGGGAVSMAGRLSWRRLHGGGGFHGGA